jgi:hypothetical protein
MKKIFGIGCFHFKFIENIEEHKYTEHLQRELGKIPSLDNFKMTNKRVYASHFLPTKEQQPLSLEDSTGYTPAFVSAQIEFTATVPKRIQEQIYNEKFVCDAEKFKVAIVYNQIFTFTVVEPIGSDEQRDGSSSVGIIGKFIKSELNKTSQSLKLEALAPSPMYLDFALQIIDGDFIKKECDFLTNDTGIKILKEYRISKCTYYGSKDKFSSIDDVLSAFINELGEEIALYYYIVLSGSYESKLWREIDGLIEEVRMSFNNSAIIGQLKKYRVGKKIDQLFLKVVEFRQYGIRISNRVKKLESFIENDKRSLVLQKYYNKEPHSIYGEMIEDTERLVSFFNKKHSNYINNTYLLGSTVIGVLIGFFLNLVIISG